MKRKDKVDLVSFTKEFDKLLEAQKTSKNEDKDITEKNNLGKVTEDLRHLLEKHSTIKNVQKKESLTKEHSPGWISKYLAKIAAFFAHGYVKNTYNSLQDPELKKTTEELKKSIADYNKNYVNNPKYQAELKKLGLELPDLKDLIE